MTGGAGADIFHTFGDAGIDRVTGLQPSPRATGSSWTPARPTRSAQVGADTVITMTGGGQMILVGVSMAALTGGWIVVG